jgi:hypothetical protein
MNLLNNQFKIKPTLVNSILSMAAPFVEIFPTPTPVPQSTTPFFRPTTKSCRPFSPLKLYAS